MFSYQKKLQMKIERFFPSPALQALVKEYIIVESDLETTSKVIPDTSVVMAFRYYGDVLKMEGERKEAIPATVVSGLRNSTRLFYYSKATANLLAVFKEGGINAFTRIPAHELFGLSISAENLFLPSDLNTLLEWLGEAERNSVRINIIESFLLKKLVTAKPDPLIGNAVKIIKQQRGIIRIKDLAASLHISQDPLEKRFRMMVGTSPKQYASIIRLRKLIRKYPSFSSLTEASYVAGYFDQSHFIKNFRLFTGQTPKDFFKSPAVW